MKNRNWQGNDKEMEIDICTALEAQWDDGYEKIKNFLQPSEELDYQELVNDGFCLWQTANGDLSISCEIGTNVVAITVRGDDDNYGYCATMDFDAYSIVCCTMSALRDYIKDIKETFVNTPV